MIILCMAAVSGITGYLLAESEPRIVAEKEEETSAVPVGAEDARITKATVIEWEYVYEMCAHRVSINSAPDHGMIGLGFAQFKNAYPNVRIVSFTPEKVVLRKRFSCYCPEHYILKKSGDELAVFRTETGKDTLSAYIDISVNFASLDKQTREELQVGRVFSTFDDLEKYLEKMIK